MTTISNVNTQLAFSLLENKGVFAVLLGSGVSRAAQIPTGWEITLDLVRRVATAQGIDEQPDWAAWYRGKTGKEPNYSTLLEELGLSPEERRSILHSYIEPNEQDRLEKRKVPTEAHRSLADLVVTGHIRLIITTNFDRLMENALRERGVEPTVVSSPDALQGAEPLTHSACYILKLHGDYKDVRILNTDAELTSYPAQYDVLLDRILDEYGLIVCGWSAEWDHALRAAFLRAPNRRYSVFWAARGEPGDGAKDLINHRRARVVPIGDANSFFVGIRELVETLEQTRRKDPISIELLVNSVKRYLNRPEHQIRLAELLAGEIDRLLNATSSEEFSPNADWKPEILRLRIKRYESLTEPLARMASVLGRWGDGSELSTVVDMVRTLCSRTDTMAGGKTGYLNIRSYPAVLIFTAYGLGLTRAVRWKTLHQFLTSQTVFRANDEPTWISQALFLWRWKGGETGFWNQIIGDDKNHYYTPLSDHLLQVFREWNTSFADLEPDFELMFDRFELLVSLVNFESCEIQDVRKHPEGGDRGQWVAFPVGRIAWSAGSYKRLASEFQSDPTMKGLLEAGFAKASDGRMKMFFEYLASVRATNLDQRAATERGWIFNANQLMLFAEPRQLPKRSLAGV
jgi:hypothetical protein